jgi:hypothetical protein
MKSICLALRARRHPGSPRRDPDRIMDSAESAIQRTGSPSTAPIGAGMNRLAAAGLAVWRCTNPRRGELLLKVAPLALTVLYR